MSQTVRRATEGRYPSCASLTRLEERKKARLLRKSDKMRKQDKPDDFIIYDDSDCDSDDEAEPSKESLNVSYNFVDYVRSRESNMREIRRINKDYATRHMLTHDMFKETPLSLGHMNKIFCSDWLSDRQVVFGTKCNQIVVYDVVTRKHVSIPSLKGRRSRDVHVDSTSGIHALSINPSRTLMASGARNSHDVAFYRLPTLDPIFIGENGHHDWVFDMCWVDDEFLVSGARDATMALWRVKEDYIPEVQDEPNYESLEPLAVKKCHSAQKVRALIYNEPFREIAALSLNGYIHIWNAETFRQRFSKKLPSCQENVCIASQDRGVYAIGCRSYTLLLDSRTLQFVRKVSARYSGCGVRSASFQDDILTIGTGVGILLFYDIRAGKYLDSSINSSRTVNLKASRGYVYPDEEFEGMQNLRYVPAVYTHCYDTSGTRLFTGGGPLPTSFTGNYAGVWE